MIIHGDSLEVLKTLEANSVDAVVTDPPYGLSFMGKKWDYDVPKIELWSEALRVLKPGGYVLSFGGTRTYHRLVVAIEDAGFEVRDQIQWLYGSGFPKSMDIAKAIDKAAGAKREVVGAYSTPDGRVYLDEPAHKSGKKAWAESSGFVKCEAKNLLTAPSTDQAKQWQGWGTALKPANEPIVLARKPLSEKTVAKNVEKWGVGGLNIDGCRIGFQNKADFDKVINPTLSTTKGYKHTAGAMTGGINRLDAGNPQGRWPANVIFDEEAAGMLDEQTKDLHGAGSKRSGGQAKQDQEGGLFGVGQHDGNGMRFGDSGGASRFFYCAKASKRERNAGLEGMPLKPSFDYMSGNPNTKCNVDDSIRKHETPMHQNHHPTVKPIRLMEYLCKLITPPGGTVLDPFCGSGSTGVAAKRLGFKFIGIEREAEYVEIAKRRLESVETTEEHEEIEQLEMII